MCGVGEERRDEKPIVLDQKRTRSPATHHTPTFPLSQVSLALYFSHPHNVLHGTSRPTLRPGAPFFKQHAELIHTYLVSCIHTPRPVCPCDDAGIPEGLYSGFPVTLDGAGNYSVVPDLDINAEQEAHIQNTVNELKSERDAVVEHLK